MGNNKRRNMGNKPVKNTANNPVPNKEGTDIKEDLEYALKILDRTDSWINSCDNKLSILIGVCGVVLTIFITTESINKAYSFIKGIIQNGKSAGVYLFLAAIIMLAVFYCIMCFHIINAVIARVDPIKYKQDKMSDASNLFFGSISKRKYSEFKVSFIGGAEQDKLNDVLTQIYINSVIASKKFELYNKCLLWIIITILFTLGMVIWGVIGF